MTMTMELSLDLDTTQDDVERCRFCGCTEENACAIPIAEELDGTVRLARTPRETIQLLPCSWYLPACCNKPECIEKLLHEQRGQRVLLYDATGRPAA